MTPIEMFWRHVDLNGLETDDDCWLWKGGLDIKGYGRFCTEWKRVKAHRFSYAYYIFNRDIIFLEQSINILHKCDSPKCINPNHLYAGTKQDNANDMLSRRRHKHNKKLYEQRDEIIKDFKTKQYNWTQLGKKYNVNPATIRTFVLRNKTTKIKKNEI